MVIFGQLIYLDGLSYDIINPNDDTVSGLINNLRSKNTENLYLTSLLNFYFADDTPPSSTIDATRAPIGLWTHPSKYENGSYDPTKTTVSSFLLSDRYNYILRNRYNINGSYGDSLLGNINRNFSPLGSNVMPNYGYSIFYFDEDNFSISGSTVKSTIDTANQYALTGQRNTVEIGKNTAPDLTTWDSEDPDAIAAANIYSICPLVNTNLDFNTPRINNIIDKNNKKIYECIRGPYKFYNLNSTPIISGTISGNNYYGSDQLIMYIKSCDLTLTPYFFNKYVSDSGNNNLKQLSNTNTLNFKITDERYLNTENIEIDIPSGKILEEL